LSAALTVAGCAGQQPGAPPPSQVTPAGPTTPAPAPTAADGDDVAACAGGNCEVELGAAGTIILLPQYRLGPVLVETISNGAATIAVADDDPHLRFACTGGTPPCRSGPLQPQQVGTLGYGLVHAGAVITANQLTINVETVTTNSVILKLSAPG
jgi:hypothetical protein